MADIICRWRNATPKTVVELVNSLPHKIMKASEFRSLMSDKWNGDFFNTPYQLACQLALYCEAEDGMYYPRFTHDIDEKEAEKYLLHWLPRYYIPNPYVGKDGFNEIHCPTYVLKALYDYTSAHPSGNYVTAYREKFKEEPKNNDDIMRNLINRFSKVLTMDSLGRLNKTDYNPQKIFGFMNRDDKKAFFNNFSLLKDIRPMDYYLNAPLEKRMEMFEIYLKKKARLKESSIKQYVKYHMNEPGFYKILKEQYSKENLYEVINIADIKSIRNKVNELPVNKQRNYVYTASVYNYENFIDFLETEESIQLFYNPDEIDKTSSFQHNSADNQETTQEQPQHEPKEIEHIPFSISQMITLINETGLLYSPSLVKRFAFSLMAKPFLILSGLAGSGKTQLAIAFANALVEDESQMCVVSVGADWTNREPLLGFPNALQEGKYVLPESGVLQLLIEANKPGNEIKPYFLILDEMNMSYVERYFADFLSAMESHKSMRLWSTGNEEVPASIALPSNLFIIGTINVDETTYMFSPKVLDRANVIEFKISEEEMAKFLDEMNPVDRESINYKAAGMGESFVALSAVKDMADSKGDMKGKLKAFFRNLKSVNAEFGYRSATEIFRYVYKAQMNDDSPERMKMEAQEILDSCIVQKLLPKLHGSRKKLEPVLKALWRECFENEADKDILTISKENVAKSKYPLTADKIQRMYEAAYAVGFTSFAEA